MVMKTGVFSEGRKLSLHLWSLQTLRLSCDGYPLQRDFPYGAPKMTDFGRSIRPR